MQSDDRDDAAKSRWVAVGDVTSLGMTLAICVMVGLFGGRWIGRKLGAEDVGVLAGVAFGVVAAGYELRRVIIRLERQAKRDQRERDQRERDNG